VKRPYAILILMFSLLVVTPVAAKTPLNDYQPEKLSAFSMKKAEFILREKLPCLGCHRLGNQGGSIGPDLSVLNKGRTAESVFSTINNPQKMRPDSLMPKIRMSNQQRNLIVNFLVQQNTISATAQHRSLPEKASGGEANDGAAIYAKYCAACHGAKGDGDGFNAQYLPVKPTAFSDAAYLSTRTDDTLFDGVFSGGRILNKSHLMPAWGDTLTPNQIHQLVEYLRHLCGCSGPSWSEK